MELNVGLQASITAIVGQDDTAIAVGSGDVDVLGTPRLIAWWEAATTKAVSAELDAGATSVGTSVDIEHLAPTAVGEQVRATAVLAGVDGRKLRFDVTAHQGEALIGQGRITRVVVDRARFISSL
jgi:fluoroacetyl-CoA thioesterase